MQGLQQKNSPIDLLTVVEELKFREELDLVGGPFYITKLTNAVFSSANIEIHARIILQKFIQRELIKISSEIIRRQRKNIISLRFFLFISKSILESRRIDSGFGRERARIGIDERAGSDGDGDAGGTGFHAQLFVNVL